MQNIIRNGLGFIFLAAVILCVAGISTAQFTIKVPKIPKAEKPKPASMEGSAPTRESAPANASSNSGSKGRHVYLNEKRPSTPAIIQPLVFIQAANSNSYWKMPNARGATSWLPEINAIFNYDDHLRIEATAEWYNPDGSLWFTEKLSSAGAGFGLSLRSNETWELINTKSTNATGVYSVKIKNNATAAVMYSAKFKVGKFLASFNKADTNKLGFYVDHDWLVPLGMVGFVGDVEKGGSSVYFSTWLKGEITYEQLEGQLFYNGKQIATRNATSGMPYEERTSKFTVPFDKDNVIKRWQFEFENVQLLNGNDHNPADFVGTHMIEKNPGQYVFKLFRNGTQIREMSFTVGADGRLVRPPYSDSFRFPQHSILLPVKVMGNQEKWNPAAWKTEMFYGNPLPGFVAQ